MSALSYVHKLLSLSDPTSLFVVRKALAAIRRIPTGKLIRLPISIELLYQLVDAIQNTVSNQYQQVLFKAMFLTAFHGFLRVGEITSSHNCISIANVNISNNTVTISLPSYKHSNGHVAVIHIHRSADRPAFCLVSALEQYISRRGTQSGPLFMARGGGISRRWFLQILRDALSFIGVASGQYNTHSFRIGAASHWASKGASDAQIRLWGRWKSDGFKAYLRVISDVWFQICDARVQQPCPLVVDLGMWRSFFYVIRAHFLWDSPALRHLCPVRTFFQ